MRHLIHFHPTIELKPFNAEWTVYNNPKDEVFTIGKRHFAEGSLVLVQFPDIEPLMTLTAARILMDVAREVKIFSVSEVQELNEQALLAAPCVPKALWEMEYEDFEALPERHPVQPIHPAQDYSNGVMYYGIIYQGQDKIVTSDSDYYGLAAAVSRNITLLQSQLSISNFSAEAVIQYFTGGSILQPEVLFRDVRQYICQYIYFADQATYDLVTVWMMGTYLFRVFRYYPYLHLNAEKGSGKTLLMELMSQISFNGVLMSQPAASTVAKLIEQSSATLFIDEAEGLSGGNNQLKQILKTGFARSGIYYIGEKMYRTFSPKCFAGINELDDVLADRAITIKMMRKSSNEHVELYRENSKMRSIQTRIRDNLYLFGLRHGPAIAGDYEETVSVDLEMTHLSNRAYDIWSPLYRIVSAFIDANERERVITSLNHLSAMDIARRQLRDSEENETGMLIQGLTEVLRAIRPIQEDGDLRYYDPDKLFTEMVRQEKIPGRVKRKGFSRLIKRILDIDSVPKAFEGSTKRMYAVDMIKFNEYKTRYGDPQSE